jgi:hypothetical protein
MGKWLYVGQYGIVEMILSLITLNTRPLCMLFSGEPIGKTNNYLEMVALEMFGSHGW